MTTRRHLVAFLIAAGALAAGPARADTFPAGSLIFPTDACYQGGVSNDVPWAPSQTPSIREGWDPTGSSCTYWDASSTSGPGSTDADPFRGKCWAKATAGYGASATGLQHAFGVLFLLAKNNIPVNIIMNGTKQALGDYDFFVESNGTNPVYYLRWVSPSYVGRSLTSTGGASVYYRGAPFVVDVAYAAKALSVLTASNLTNTIFSDVTIHVANNDFLAPVLATIATTPKPIGLVSYSNSNGYNIAKKYMNDAGIVYALGAGEGTTFVTISASRQGNLSYTWAGAPAAACTNGKCNVLSYVANNVKTKILDVLWAPDINQSTCADVQPNPTLCYDSSSLCLADTCVGAKAWCCPAGNTTPSYPPTFSYSNPDGTTTPYYCPCPQAGTSGSSNLCSIANWQYDGAASCISGLGTGNQNGCTGATTCDYGAQQCLKNCTADSGCATGYKCQTVNAGPTGCTANNQCPSGYPTCTAGVCVSTQKVCVRSAAGLNPAATTPCSPACAASEYCDPADATCKPKYGCGVACSSCPGGAAGKLSTVWQNLSTGTGGFNDFLVAGGTVLGTDTTAATAEGSQNWITSTGLTSSTAGSASGALFCASAVQNTPSVSAIAGFTAATNPTYPASNIFLQIGDYLYRVLGGNSPTYAPLSTFRNTSVTGLAYQNGASWSYPVITGPPGTCTTSGACITCTLGTSTCQTDPSKCTTPANRCGTVVYEGANNYASSSTSAPAVKLPGQHIIYDTLLQGASGAPGTPGTNDPNPTYPVELSRSTPVASPLTGQFYVGTFDWQYTIPRAGSGNAQWSPPPGSYPFASGHFRQYNPATSDSNGAFTGAVWDLNDWLTGNGNTPPPRKIYFASKSGTTWSLLAFTSANASAVARQMFNVTSPSSAQLATANAVITKVLANRKLGGVDYSSAAVIEAPHGVVAGAGTLRPTIAYVGARDGMLHAVCVGAKGGTIASPGQCYGQSAGSELWAVIPPTVLSAMAVASAANDWSNINVGGAIRVGDVFDFLNPSAPTSKIWKTVLLFGTRQLGSVAAMDISNPDPTVVNQADFRFLWENNRTNTTPAMGATLGATLATPSTTSVALVTSGTSGTASGINTYTMRVYDGTVLASSTITYTRPLPALAGTFTIPNGAPALATVLDSDGDGLDDGAVVTDFQGDVLKFGLSTTGFTGTSPFYTKLFDTSAGCTGGTACQPISASASVARRLATNPTFVMLVASGGADWADTSSTARYYMYGINAGVTTTATTPMFRRGLGTLATPVPNGGGTTQVMPLRTYAQPTVVGSDLYIDGTTLSTGSVQQLLIPVIYGGIWGEGIRFGLGATPDDASVSANPSYLVPISGSYGGGAGSAVFSNGTIIEVGSSGVFQHVLTSSEAQTSTPRFDLKVAPATNRSFKLLNWFQIGD